MSNTINTDIMNEQEKANQNATNLNSILSANKQFSTSSASKYLSKANNASVSPMTRVVNTYNDVMQNVSKDFIGGAEGLVDTAATAIGYLGDDNFKNKIKEFTSKDYSTGIANDVTSMFDIYGNVKAIANGYNPFDDEYQYNVREESYISDLNTKAQNTIRGVAGGVGQVASMVAMNGLGTKAAMFLQGGKIASGVKTVEEAMTYAKKAGQVTSMLGLGLSASGSAIVEAQNEGADYNQAFGYGLLSGASEVGIEYLSAGLGKLTGRAVSAIPGVSTAVNKASTTVGGKILDLGLQGLSEGAEEAVSDYVNPFLKMIYKDKYETPEFNDVIQDFAVGGLTSLIVSGAVSIQNGVVESIDKKNQAKVDLLNKTVEEYKNKLDSTGDFKNMTIEAKQSALDELKTSQNKVNAVIDDLNSDNNSTKGSETSSNVVKNDLSQKDNNLLGQEIKSDLNENSNTTTYNDTKVIKDTNIKVLDSNIDTNTKNSSAIPTNPEVVKSQNINRFESRYGDSYSDSFKSKLKDSQLDTVVYSDKEALKGVNASINENTTYNDLINYKNEFVAKYQQGKRLDKTDIAKAYKVVDELTNTHFDYDASTDLLKTISIYLTESGRITQAAKMMNYFSPEGRLDIYDKMVEKANTKQEGRKLNKNILDSRRKKYFDSDIKSIKERTFNNKAKANGIEIKDTQKILESISEKVNMTSDEVLNVKKELAKTLYDNGLSNTKLRNKFVKDFVDTYTTKINELDTKYNTKAVLIPESIIDEVIKDKNGKNIDETRKKVVSVLDEQYNSTFWEKVEAYRSVSMLFNAKTHIRNFVGNFVMDKVRAVKDTVASSLEKAFIRNPELRTKTTTKVSKEMKAHAIETFSNELFNSSKYDLTNRNVWTSKASKPLNTIYKWNMNMLEKEDQVFLKKIYVDTYSKYCTAKGYSVDFMKANPDIQAEAMNYAIKEAEINTFKEESKLANTLNDIQSKNAISRILVGGVIPFKKTPINIVKIGVRYSPIGLMKTFTYNSYQLRKGKISINTYIDNVSQGLTGSAIMALGMTLANMGLLSIGGSDDSEDYNYNKTTGKQQYALKVGDFSYTLDWLSPSAIPLFMGVSLMEGLGNNSESAKDALINAVANSIDPVNEMSMLQGINNSLSSVKNGDNPIGSLLGSVAQSYSTSFIPTISSQIAKIVDPYARTSTATKNNALGSKSIQKYFNTLIAKVPGLSLTLEPYVDCWGVKNTNYNSFATGLSNIFQQSASPGWWSFSKTDSVDNELSRLVESTGDTTIIPNIPNSYYSVDGVRYDMTAKEYTEFKIGVGSNSKKLLNSLMTSSLYIQFSDEDKIKLINKAYTLARDYQKKSGIFKNFKESLINFENFSTYYLLANSLDTKKEKLEFINASTLTSNQKNYLLDSLGI